MAHYYNQPTTMSPQSQRQQQHNQQRPQQKQQQQQQQSKQDVRLFNVPPPSNIQQGSSSVYVDFQQSSGEIYNRNPNCSSTSYNTSILTGMGKSTNPNLQSFYSNSNLNKSISSTTATAPVVVSSQQQQGVIQNNSLSEIEAAILRSTVPIDVKETDVIEVNGQRGIWANKAETSSWRGPIPISQYTINDDPNPEIINKESGQQIVYQQEVAIRYLRPPTPPPPGEILIKEEPYVIGEAAPPLVIRQQPPRPTTPQPLVIREAPPSPPPVLGRRIITISGKKVPPPPRKVIIERLAPLPTKPQSVIIERWLPYRQIKRKVIYTKAPDSEQIAIRPKNVIVQWDSPQVTVHKEFKDLGIVRTNPTEYVQRYGTSLKRAIELPPFVKEIKPPSGLVLAADSSEPVSYELEGDIYALNLVDLERENLVEYRHLLKQLKPSESTKSMTSIYSSSSATQNNVINLGEIFNTVDIDQNNTISITDAEKLLIRLNTRLGRRHGEEDSKSFFSNIDLTAEGRLDIYDFKQNFEKQLR